MKSFSHHYPDQPTKQDDKEAIRAIVDYLSEKGPQDPERIQGLEGGRIVPVMVPDPAAWSNRLDRRPGKWQRYVSSERLLLDRQNQTRLISALTAEEMSQVKEDNPELYADLARAENPRP